MLLCTMFTQGGADDMHIIDLLMDDDAYALQEKAQAILAIDGEKRAAILVREIRNQTPASIAQSVEILDRMPIDRRARLKGAGEPRALRRVAEAGPDVLPAVGARLRRNLHEQVE